MPLTRLRPMGLRSGKPRPSPREGTGRGGRRGTAAHGAALLYRGGRQVGGPRRTSLRPPYAPALPCTNALLRGWDRRPRPSSVGAQAFGLRRAGAPASLEIQVGGGLSRIRGFEGRTNTASKLCPILMTVVGHGRPVADLEPARGRASYTLFMMSWIERLILSGVMPLMVLYSTCFFAAAVGFGDGAPPSSRSPCRRRGSPCRRHCAPARADGLDQRGPRCAKRPSLSASRIATSAHSGMSRALAQQVDADPARRTRPAASL